MDSPRRRLSSAELHAEAERQMAEALSPEKLRDNPLRGKPLKIEDNPYDRGMGLAYRMLRNAGFSKLPWMEDEEEIRRGKAELESMAAAHLDWLQSWVARNPEARPAVDLVRARHARARTDLTQRAADLRGKIERFNLTVPVPGRQVKNVRPERVVGELDAAAAPLLRALGAQSM